MATVSDILAMNGLPTGITVNLALPNKISVEMIEQLYQGIHYAGEVGHFELIGGDITATRGPLVVSITVYGKADAERITYRSGAKPDDAICVTGDLGGAIAGLRILLREKVILRVPKKTRLPRIWIIMICSEASVTSQSSF